MASPADLAPPRAYLPCSAGENGSIAAQPLLSQDTINAIMGGQAQGFAAEAQQAQQQLQQQQQQLQQHAQQQL
jgi:hypothetical protein